MALLDVIDTEDTRNLLHTPGLLIGREVKAGPRGPAPLPNTGLTGTDPEIARKPLRERTDRHPILLDGGDGRGDDPIGVAGIGTEEGRLSTKGMAAGGTEMDADSDE